ncbi:MAG TPA: copper resistance protein CopC [Aggregatilineales bacterium]|nr:copper resistance protein CopC [Aggregatilineales bacterium]
MRWRWIIVVFLLGVGLLGVHMALAHALLDHSSPSANEVLASPPQEIRLWFTEGLEPQFSHFKLLDTKGQTVNAPPSQVDPKDATQMFMNPGHLPDGLYVVLWNSVSATDGHAATGSFEFTIGSAAAGSATAAPTSESIPLRDSVIRWLNLVSMALVVGSLGFWLFVWDAAIDTPQPSIERRMARLIWIGWVFLGITGVLMLLLQTSVAANISLLEAITNSALLEVLRGTHFGALWYYHIVAWLVLGGCLSLADRDGRYRWAALGAGEVILLTNSLFTHAVATPDPEMAVNADLFHLSMTALWVGGLVQFLNVIGPVRRAFTPATPVVGTLVGYFSNFARVAVAGLVLTGLYAAWLDVGSVEALFITPYGQVLLVKLALLIPLLAIAGLNLVLTHRGLHAGREVWVGRLRGLVGVEIALTFGILAAVGVMTSLSPSRAELKQAASASGQSEDHSYADMQMTDNMHVTLDISPGTVGQNTFRLSLLSFDDGPVTDASLIRLRFNHKPDTLGQSELHMENQGNGTYTVSGSNLAQAGDWRIQVNIQRPGQFDTVVAFSPYIVPAPASSVPVPADPTGTERLIAMILVGLAALAVGGYSVAVTRPPLWRGSGVVAIGMSVLGLVFLMNAALTLVGQVNR